MKLCFIAPPLQAAGYQTHERTKRTSRLPQGKFPASAGKVPGFLRENALRQR